MELLSNINKNSFFSRLMRLYLLFSFAMHVESQLSGTGVMVVLRQQDVGVGVQGEVDFLQVRRCLVGVWGDCFGLLPLAAHFLIYWGHWLHSVVFPHLQLTGDKQSVFSRLQSSSQLTKRVTVSCDSQLLIYHAFRFHINNSGKPVKMQHLKK